MKSRFGGRVPDVEVEDHVGFGQRAALFDELVGNGAQALQPAAVDEPLHRQPAVLPVVRALFLGEGERAQRRRHAHTLRAISPR